MPAPAAEPHLFVVFGATGDLMQRKLLPALFHLREQGLFPAGSLILGVARHPLDDATFRTTSAQSLVSAVPDRAAGAPAFCAATVFYYGLTAETADGYRALRGRIEQLETEHHLSGNRIFYLALPLEAFGPTLEGLGGAGLNRGRAGRASSLRSRSAGTCAPPRPSTASPTSTSRRNSSTGSTTTSGKRRSRTCSFSDSRTLSSSPTGTGSAWNRWRSPWPRVSGSRAGRGTMRPRGRSGT